MGTIRAGRRQPPREDQPAQAKCEQCDTDSAEDSLCHGAPPAKRAGGVGLECGWIARDGVVRSAREGVPGGISLAA